LSEGSPTIGGVSTDEDEINRLVSVFFDAFTSGPGTAERLDALRGLFVPRALVTRTCGQEPTVYTVDEFVAPRQRILEDGTLTGFREWAVDGHVEIFGDIAHWFGSYAKEGLHNGADAAGRGMKSIQYIRTTDGWRITAAAWDDERPGLTLP
jgi:hypothetical protein